MASFAGWRLAKQNAKLRERIGRRLRERIDTDVNTSSSILRSLMCIGVPVALMASSAAAQDVWPPFTPEGLERVPTERADVVYWRPAATLAPYERIMLVDCTVAFRKNWEQGQEARRAVYKADAEDMARMRSLLAQEFTAILTQELQERGGYQIVDAAGEDVLVLQPSIVDLDVGAPVLDVPGTVVNYVSSAGEMTLHLDLVDSVTNSIIGRVVDRQEGSKVEGFLISDSVTNRAEADRILRGWATTLRAALDDRWRGAR